jgi:uncharacterized C2H2 Zn-finger protein
VTTEAFQDAPTGDGDPLIGCSKCSMRVRQSEMDIHLAHAHNTTRDSKKPQKKYRKDRDR